MDNIMAYVAGWTHTRIYEPCGPHERHKSWMYEYVSPATSKHQIYIQIKKELDTGLYDVIYCHQQHEDFPQYNVFYNHIDACKFIALIILHHNRIGNIGLSKSAINYLNHVHFINPQEKKKKIIEDNHD